MLSIFPHFEEWRWYDTIISTHIGWLVWD